MQFEDALAVLVGWLGEDLQVTLHGAGDMAPVMAAELFGRLRRGGELSGGSEPANALMFMLDSADGEEVSSFILEKDAFLSAGWFDQHEEVLEINSGVIQFLICLDND